MYFSRRRYCWPGTTWSRIQFLPCFLQPCVYCAFGSPCREYSSKTHYSWQGQQTWPHPIIEALFCPQWKDDLLLRFAYIAYSAYSAMTTPSANPLRAACVPAVLQKCFFSCETITLPVHAVRGTFCEGFPTFSKCVSLPPPHSLRLCFLSHCLPSKPTYTWHPQRAPLRVHLTPETSEPWDGQMVDAGWELMHVHIFCAPTPLPSVRMSSVKVEHRKREIKHYALYCKRLLCIPVHFNYWNGTCIVDISCSLRRCFPVSSTHFRAQRFTAAMLSAVLGSYPSCFVLGPYLSRWPTVGRELRPYLCDLGDKQTHCISNIRNALEHRSESGDARDTVQPQTVWVICLLVKPDRSNGEHTTGREARSALSD